MTAQHTPHTAAETGPLAATHAPRAVGHRTDARVCATPQLRPLLERLRGLGRLSLGMDDPCSWHTGWRSRRADRVT
jgi:hypothetical protein